ncbi:MAG: tRNA pseudouridine(55) synthase TruB [Chitinispirillaceae bacterium]|nr:tRNA pseudouridine(55) synthase TruB [Chitinispirillaceae bacterium]
MNKNSGFLLVDKPKGVTSFDVVRRMRTIFSCRKIGHAGTLDPQAEGVLVLAFGQATRLIKFLPTEPKTYAFTIQFGTQTDSLDAAGTIVHSEGRIPDHDTLVSAIPLFIGLQMQTPPAFSALKINGVRAYSLARNGRAPQLPPREITIYSLSLLHYEQCTGRAQCLVECSGGTYVRALARDIASKLDTVGYASSIRRRSCGKFKLADAHRLEDVTASTPILSVRRTFDEFPRLQIDHSTVQKVAYGRDIVLPQLFPINSRNVMLFKGEELAAVLIRVEGNVFHPSHVFLSPEGVPGAASSAG